MVYYYICDVVLYRYIKLDDDSETYLDLRRVVSLYLLAIPALRYSICVT